MGNAREISDHRSAPNIWVKPTSLSSIVIAWTVVLLVSALPDAIWQALAGATPTWLFWVKVGVLFVMIMLGWVWTWLYSLRPFVILLLILTEGRKTLNCLGMTPSYVPRGEQVVLHLPMEQFEGSRLLLTAVMVAALLIMGKRRQDFFLVKGDLKKMGASGNYRGSVYHGFDFPLFRI